MEIFFRVKNKLCFVGGVVRIDSFVVNFNSKYYFGLVMNCFFFKSFRDKRIKDY